MQSIKSVEQNTRDQTTSTRLFSEKQLLIRDQGSLGDIAGARNQQIKPLREKQSSAKIEQLVDASEDESGY